MRTTLDGFRRRVERAANRIPTGPAAYDRQYARMSRDELRLEIRRLVPMVAADHPLRACAEHVLTISPHASDEERQLLAEEIAKAVRVLDVERAAQGRRPRS